MQEMLQEQQDRFYYTTVTNVNDPQPSMPAGEAVPEGILKGMYRLPLGTESAQVQLLGSGAIMTEVLRARELLLQDWNVEAAVWSVTSYSELHRDGIQCERQARLQPLAKAPIPFVGRALGDASGPVIAATDYVRAVPELIRAFVSQPYTTLGTDGFGRSDTRTALRVFFEVNAASIVVAALSALAATNSIDRARVAEAILKYGCDADAPAPWTR
jgi:pyruvate dehydrogenase E1 component